MKLTKRVLSLFLCVLMLVSYLPVNAFAAGGATNLTTTLSATEVNVGDTFTVKIGNKAMTVSSIAFGIGFDTDLLEVTSITKTPTIRYEYYDEEAEEDTTMNVAPTALSTVEEANASGNVGVTYAGANDIDYINKNGILTVTFTAKASGVAEFTFFEDSAGTDGYKGEWTHDETVVIGGSEPEADCDLETPHSMTLPFSESSEDPDYDHYYSWTAPADGTLTLKGNESALWVLHVNGEEKINAADPGQEKTYPVVKGDEIVFNAYTMSGGSIGATWSVTFEEKKPVVTTKYDITWDAGNGKPFIMEVTAGTVPSYPAQLPTPTKESDAEFDYTFSGWSPAPYAADKDQTYTAQFTAAPKAVYEITWIVDGDRFTSPEVPYNTTPTFPATESLPTGCVELSWSPAIAPATKDTTYTLVVTPSHTYKYDCSTECSNCGEGHREASHVSDADHTCEDGVCKFGCGTAMPATEKHSYKFDCSTECQTCGEGKREASHVSNAAHECVDGECKFGCGTKMPATEKHSYKFECSTECQTCGEGHREASHGYNHECDKNCKFCGEVTNPNAAHVSDADHTCEDGVCKFGCGTSMPATAEHSYKFDCSTECQTCGEGHREASHGYNYDCDKNCKFCDEETRPNAAHVSNAAYACVDGKCQYCGTSMPATAEHSFTHSYDNKGDTHSATCVCGVEIENQPHVYDKTTHKCVCGDVEEFTLTFTINGEAYGEPVDVEFGEAITAPAYTIPEGHTFSGWDVPATMPGKDLTIDATLTPNPYTVTLSGDCVTMDAVTAYHGQELVVKLHNDTGSSNRGVELRQVRVNGQIIDEKAYTFDENNTLTIPGELITGNVSISAEACVNVTIDINGAEVYLHEQLAQGLTIEQLKAMLAEYCGYTEGSDIVNVYGVTYGSNSYAVLREFLTFFNKPHHNFGGFQTQDGTILEPNEVGAVQIDGDMQLTMLWEIEKFTLTVDDIAGEEHVLEVPYGTNIVEFLKTQDFYAEEYALNAEDMTGILTFIGWLDENDEGIQDDAVVTDDMYISTDYLHTGWLKGDLGWGYEIDNIFVSGWQLIDGDWYYLFLDENSGWSYRAEGMTRVPYPTEEINGITYGPNAEDMADPDYTDAEEAWFAFDADGKFTYNAMGIATYGENDSMRKLTNGQAVWHTGMVQVIGAPHYMYFIGDSEEGGNILATGDVYVKRNTTKRDFVIGGVYTFDAEGKLCEYDGITEVNGVKRYYEDAQLMIGNGLTAVDKNFIYVDRDGELVVDAYYWVPANDLEVVEGIYYFDENGYLQAPQSTEKEGVYFENNNWYYYVDGVKQTNKGLISVENVIWHLEDATEATKSGIIYVKTNGALATGNYWVTTITNYKGDDVKSGDLLNFDDLGLRAGLKNGMFEENGTLYFYKNGIKAYNAGVTVIDGKYYYVKSNAEVVRGRSYWITNVGDTEVVAKNYVFAADGSFEPEFLKDVKNGIVDGYYYVDGQLQYAAGVVYLEEEDCYIYVRSSGQIATGIYWATNTNGLLESKSYDWGNDGKLYL